MIGVVPLEILTTPAPQVEMMVILRANQEFMRQSRKKYPEAIKKLGHLFGVPTVDVEVEEEEEDLAGADASAKKRAKLDKENLPDQKQAKLSCFSLAKSAANKQ